MERVGHHYVGFNTCRTLCSIVFEGKIGNTLTSIVAKEMAPSLKELFQICSTFFYDDRMGILEVKV